MLNNHKTKTISNYTLWIWAFYGELYALNSLLNTNFTLIKLFYNGDFKWNKAVRKSSCKNILSHNYYFLRIGPYKEIY